MIESSLNLIWFTNVYDALLEAVFLYIVFAERGLVYGQCKI